MIIKVQFGEECRSLQVLVNDFSRAIAAFKSSDDKKRIACLVYERLIVFMLSKAAHQFIEVMNYAVFRVEKYWNYHGQIECQSENSRAQINRSSFTVHDWLQHEEHRA